MTAYRRVRRRHNAAKGERGAVSLEIALLLPVIVLVACAATAIWRIWWSGQQLEASAAAAARAASHANTVVAAEAMARAVIAADMATAGVHCGELVVNADVVAASAQPGAGGRMNISVSCRVGLRDLVVPGLPGELTLRAQATEIVDTFVRR
ncbi:MAG: pilus assembly protein [Propionibacteriaceae bacterium]|nr:pilus assembly protein [Propionibacteriaceae bacterium]